MLCWKIIKCQNLDYPMVYGLASHQNITKIEKTLITCYCCCTILVKLRYINKGSTTCQHVLKGNIVSFAQDLESAIKLLDTLPLSLESLSIIITIHFVGSSHPSIEY